MRHAAFRMYAMLENLAVSAFAACREIRLGRDTQRDFALCAMPQMRATNSACACSADWLARFQGLAALSAGRR